MQECFDQNTNLRGVMLGSHGLFTWGETAYESYINILEVIERCAEYLEDNYGKKKPVFGGRKIKPLSKQERQKKAVSLLAIIISLETCNPSDADQDITRKIKLPGRSLILNYSIT